MLYKNANIFTPDRGFIYGSFETGGGRFICVTLGLSDAPAEDLQGAYVLPGLIDLHCHGALGADFSDGVCADLERMAAYLYSKGVMSFAPATMTLPYETLAAAFAAGRKLRDNPVPGCARLIGAHMEGPFFSEKRKGAQNAAYLKEPDYEAFNKLNTDADGLVKIVDVASELPGAADFTAKASKDCVISIAHSDSGYEDAAAVFEAGATHLTHLYNAMPPIHHRKPGIIGAASENEAVIAELICDGLHVHPSSVRMAFKLFPGRICLISDSLRCCGMPDGEYEFGGQRIYLNDSVATMTDGTLAGSTTNLFNCMLNAISFGIPREEAILAATLTPARQLGVEDSLGSISPGKLADFLICDEELKLISVHRD